MNEHTKEWYLGNGTRYARSYYVSLREVIDLFTFDDLD